MKKEDVIAEIVLMVLGTIMLMLTFALAYLIVSFILWEFITVGTVMIRIGMAASVLFGMYVVFDYNEDNNSRE